MLVTGTSDKGTTQDSSLCGLCAGPGVGGRGAQI